MSYNRMRQARYLPAFPEEVFNVPSAVDWQTGGTYNNTDIVRYAHVLYQCLLDHTGLSTAPDEDTRYWRRFSKTALPAAVVNTNSQSRRAFWPTRSS